MSPAAATVALFTKNRTNPAYVGARLGADRVAARLGCRTRHYVPETPDDIGEQIALLKAAVADRPDAIVIAPTHPTALLPTLETVHAAGIPVLTLVSRAEDGRIVCHIGSDDVALAARVSRHLFRALGGRGSVLFVGGHPDSTTSLDRERGFRQALQDCPGIALAAACRGDYQHEPARLAVAEALKSGIAIDGIMAANDLMAMGVIDALAAAGRRMPVVGVNAVPEAAQAIRNGTMLATAAFDAMTMACIAAEAAIRHLRGEPIPREITLPVEIVDGSNCAAWNLPYEERPLPDWDAVTRRATP